MERRNDFKAPIRYCPYLPLAPEEKAYGEFTGAPQAFYYTEVID